MPKVHSFQDTEKDSNNTGEIEIRELRIRGLYIS